MARAVRWNGTTPTVLDDLGGPFAGAESINDSGEVAGWSRTAGDTGTHAVRWNGTTAIDLGALGGDDSRGLEINASGTIVGYANVGPGGYFRPVLWNGTIPTVLGTLGGDSASAYGINSAGDVIGNSGITPGGINEAGFIYTGGTMYNLLSLIEPGTGITNLQVGTGGNCINDSGQIAAFARTNSSRYVVLLTPTPEPSSAVLGIFGAVALALRRRRPVRK